MYFGCLDEDLVQHTVIHSSFLLRPGSTSYILLESSDESLVHHPQLRI